MLEMIMYTSYNFSQEPGFLVSYVQKLNTEGREPWCGWIDGTGSYPWGLATEPLPFAVTQQWVNANNRGQLPGKGDSAMFAFSEFGKTFSILQQKNRKLETSTVLDTPTLGFPRSRSQEVVLIF